MMNELLLNIFKCLLWRCYYEGLLLYVHDLLVNCCGDYKRLCCSCKVLKICIKVRIYIGLSRLKSETDAEILRLFVASLQDERLLTVGSHTLPCSTGLHFSILVHTTPQH